MPGSIIAGGARTPIGKLAGALGGFPAVDLGGMAIKAALRIEGVPEPVTFWMSTAQFGRWRHTHLTVDLVPGRGSGFSLEAPEGVRFLIRSRLLTRAENAILNP